jgi:coenzyme F420-reducing hydrogenase delta subunit
MSEECATVVSINQDYCSRCSVCFSICPYKAIKRDEETGKVEIDIQECQVCGICYSACPASAIEMTYYAYGTLINYVNSMKTKMSSDTLILMCRGNSPSTCEVDDILKAQGLSVKNYIPLRIPCSGRVPAEFIFKALASGIKNIISIQCEDTFCRFKEGTKINTRRLILSKNVLTQLGISPESLRVVKYSRKAIYDTEKCVGCDKCVFICPYKAIEAEPFATPKIIAEDCMGCGACALVCPHHAIQVKGFEFEDVLNRYGQAAARLKENGRGPAVLAFVCQWSEFQALDNPSNVFSGRNVLALEVPCFKAMDPVHVVNALNCGFDGVMAVVCSSKDCKLQEGRDTAERNLEVLTDVLKKKNLADRFDFYEVSPRCLGDFKKKLDTFYTRISDMKKQLVVEVEGDRKRTE